MGELEKCRLQLVERDKTVKRLQESQSEFDRARALGAAELEKTRAELNKTLAEWRDAQRLFEESTVLLWMR